jgi:hypothetical protein
MIFFVTLNEKKLVGFCTKLPDPAFEDTEEEVA